MNDWWTSAPMADYLRRHRWAALGVAALLMVVSVVVWKLIPEKHTIAVNGLGETLTFVTTQQELGAALSRQGIAISPKDRVVPALSTSLEGQKQVTVDIRKAVPVTVAVDGKVVTVDTAAETVAQVLKELEITLGPKDSMTADASAPIVAGLSLEITRRSEDIQVVREEIPFEVVREADRNMMAGETREIQEGVAGIRQIKKIVYYENGQEVGAEILEEAVLADPVDRVVAYGTMGVVSRGGRDYRYTQEMVLSATGYTAGKESNPDGNGYTYTGMKAVRGVVAVDPNVIPLYTRVYVEGYGPAIAADIGGAIKGNKIDLCFDTVEEALEWGRRPVTVYILAD